MTKEEKDHAILDFLSGPRTGEGLQGTGQSLLINVVRYLAAQVRSMEYRIKELEKKVAATGIEPAIPGL